MRAKIIKFEEQPSKHGGIFYYLFMADGQGRSYRTCLYPAYRNFKRWEPVLEAFRAGKEIWLDGLIERSKGFVNADSPFYWHRVA